MFTDFHYVQLDDDLKFPFPMPTEEVDRLDIEEANQVDVKKLGNLLSS